MTDPSFERWSPPCPGLPLLYSLTSDRPAQPHSWRCDQWIKKHHLMRRSNYRFDESFLFLQPITANDPGILNVRFPIGCMAKSPFITIKRRTLKLQGPSMPISMHYKDIRN